MTHARATGSTVAAARRPSRREQMRENPVEQRLYEGCLRSGFMCLKFTSPARDGVPDRVVVTPVGTVFVELKRPGERPRRNQRVMHDRMRRAGAEVYVIDSFEGADALVDQLRERKELLRDHDQHTPVCPRRVPADGGLGNPSDVHVGDEPGAADWQTAFRPARAAHGAV